MCFCPTCHDLEVTSDVIHQFHFSFFFSKLIFLYFTVLSHVYVNAGCSPEPGGLSLCFVLQSPHFAVFHLQCLFHLPCQGVFTQFMCLLHPARVAPLWCHQGGYCEIWTYPLLTGGSLFIPDKASVFPPHFLVYQCAGATLSHFCLPFTTWWPRHCAKWKLRHYVRLHTPEVTPSMVRSALGR